MDLKLSASSVAAAGLLTLLSCTAPETSRAPTPEARSATAQPTVAEHVAARPVVAEEVAARKVAADTVAAKPAPEVVAQAPVTSEKVVAPAAPHAEVARKQAPVPDTKPIEEAIPATKLTAAKPVHEAPPMRASVPQTGPSAFGEPLVINGKRVTDNEIKRFLIYGPCRLILEMYRINLIVDDELNGRAQRLGNQAIEPQVKEIAESAANAAIDGKTFATPEEKQKAKDAAYAEAYAAAQKRPELQKIRAEVAASELTRLHEAMAPTESEFQAEVKTNFDEFRNNYPHLDLDAEVSRAFRNPDWFRRNLRQTMLFDKVFYPEDPADWPDATVESVRADSGEALLDDAVNSYKMRKEHSDKTGEPLRKEDGIYTNMMRQIVRDALFHTVDFKTSFDGLPDDLLLTADKDGDGKNEMVVTTAEVWDVVKDTVSQDEIDQAKQWFVASMAAADRLRADGFELDPAARKEAIAALNKQFVGTYINVEILATQTVNFPSVESYKEYYCMTEGFKKLMEPKLVDGPNGDLAQPLRDHLDRANKVMGLGQVDVEVMLLSAFDIPHFKWKPDGWNWAKRQATEIKAKIDAHAAKFAAQREEAAKAQAEGREFKPATPVDEPYVYWTSLMNDHSEYWDPPPPDKTGRKAEVGMKNRGRFGLRYRNDLLAYVGETQYSHWVTGQCITDKAFFDGPEGVVQGPFKGPLGYYLTRVAKRTPPTYPLNVSEPKKADLLKQDYLRTAFIDYTRESVSKADVKGFKPE